MLGRHVLVLPRNAPLASRIEDSSSPRRVLIGIERMFTMFPYWDVSWLIGVCFTVGCLIFVACGLFYWLPIAFPQTAFAGSKLAGGITSLVGATLFQVGAVLLFLESYNDRAETKFGGAMEHLFVDHLRIARRSRRHRPKHMDMQTHEQMQQSASNESSSTSGQDVSLQATSTPDSREKDGDDDNPFAEREWQWWPSWHDVKTHYIFEIGFLASFAMSVGATIFYVCGIMAMPQILDSLSVGAKQGVYFFTYLLGGVLFIISAILYILETQPNWYTPQPYKIGWHVGVFNLIGGTGWTLAASFGYCSINTEWCEYQGQLTLIWASCAFAFGSALQWYESLDKYVVVIED